MLPEPTRPELPRSLFSAAVAVAVMLTVAGGDWWNVAAAAAAEKTTMMMMMTVVVAVLAAVHPIPNCCWGLRGRWPAMALLKTAVVTMMTETTTVRAEYGRANGPAGEVHMGQACKWGEKKEGRDTL